MKSLGWSSRPMLRREWLDSPALTDDRQLSPGSTGAFPVWAAMEGCRWYLCHSLACRKARALFYMSSCMCWVSGMSNPELIGTTTSRSTGKRSSQVSSWSLSECCHSYCQLTLQKSWVPISPGTKLFSSSIGLFWN